MTAPQMAASDLDCNEEANAFTQRVKTAAEGHTAPLEAGHVYCSFNEPHIRYSGCFRSCSSTLGFFQKIRRSFPCPQATLSPLLILFCRIKIPSRLRKSQALLTISFSGREHKQEESCPNLVESGTNPTLRRTCRVMHLLFGTG